MSTADRTAVPFPYVGVILGLVIALTCISPVSAAPVSEGDAPNTRVFIPIISHVGSQPAWLAYLNGYRAACGLPLLAENTTWSQGDALHARYMVKNNTIGHSEDPGNSWYTAEGALAAQNSNVMKSSGSGTPDSYAIDLWLLGPFHAVGMLDPKLQQVGFGSYREGSMAAALDVLRGRGSLPGSVAFPVRWPGSGATVALSSFGGGESPNPLTSCGYTGSTGLPVILQIGPGNLTPSVTAHSFQQGSTSLEHCVFDETSYTNPNGGDQSLGRSVLGSRDAIVLIPRSPLSRGKTYTVSITANGQAYTWSFAIAP